MNETTAPVIGRLLSIARLLVLGHDTKQLAGVL